MLDVSEIDNVGRWRVFYVKASNPDYPLNRQENYCEQWRRQFRCFTDMPTRTKEAVSCLAMGKDGEKIAGIGQKVSGSTYWVDSTPEILEEYDGV